MIFVTSSASLTSKNAYNLVSKHVSDHFDEEKKTIRNHVFVPVFKRLGPFFLHPSSPSGVTCFFFHLSINLTVTYITGVSQRTKRTSLKYAKTEQNHLLEPTNHRSGHNWILLKISYLIMFQQHKTAEKRKKRKHTNEKKYSANVT